MFIDAMFGNRHDVGDLVAQIPVGDPLQDLALSNGQLDLGLNRFTQRDGARDRVIRYNGNGVPNLFSFFQVRTRRGKIL